jgi:hypothetical protein
LGTIRDKRAGSRFDIRMPALVQWLLYFGRFCNGFPVFDMTSIQHTFTQASPLLLTLGLAFILRFIMLTAALWIMLRVQELPYSVAGMVASSALACVFDMIPLVGHPAAVAVLLLCVIRMTRAHFIDVRFTVAISYAVLFLMQMLVLSALPDKLTAYARTRAVDAIQHPEEDPTGFGDDATDTAKATVAAANPDAGHAAPLLKSNDVAQVIGASAPAPAPAPAPKPVVGAPSAREVGEFAHDFALKGVFNNSRDSQVIFFTGSKTYTIGYGESLRVETPHGDTTVRLEKVADNSAVLEVAGGTVPLKLR